MARCVLWLFPALLLLVLELPTTWCFLRKMNVKEMESELLDNLLSRQKYDPRIRPVADNDMAAENPTTVKVDIFFRRISKVDDYRMEYTAEITFRGTWVDDRLKFNNSFGRIKYLTLTEIYRIWTPDVFFSNEKEGYFHNIITPNVYVRIFPDGRVLYSIRTTLVLSCPMDLRLYPMDQQLCSLRLASYGWTTDDIVFLWKDGDPVQVDRSLIMPYFTLEKFTPDYCDTRTITGEFSCLKVDFLFKRQLSRYLSYIYFPCSMLVIVSWMCFWLDQDAITARVCLGTTTLLTLVIRIVDIFSTVPSVTYTKAIDMWLWVSLTFVFMALPQSILVNFVRSSDLHREKTKQQRRPVESIQTMKLENDVSWDTMKSRDEQPEKPADSPFAQEEVNKVRESKSEQQPKKKNCCRTWFSRIPSRSKRIDVISRIIFPLAFLIFNIVYWCIYLCRVDILQ